MKKALLSLKPLLVCGLLALALLSCNKKDKKVPVTKIDVVEITDPIVVGNTQQISARVLPVDATDKTLTYTSEKEEIATVDEKGLISAISVGTTKISIKSENNIEVQIDITVERVPFKIPATFVGNWVGVKVAVIASGVTYDEEGIKDKFFGDKTPEEQDATIIEMRTWYKYSATSENVVTFGIGLQGGTYASFDGALDYGEEENAYTANFDFTGQNIKDFNEDDYQNQDIKFDGTNIVANLPMGSMRFITYYEVQ